MERELKTLQLVALTHFSPVVSEFIFQVFPIFKWKSRSEMQPLWAEHNQPPTAQRNATGVLGRVGNGKEDDKSQQGNFRWQEPKV